MKRFFREVEAIWRRTLHRRSQKAGMFMPPFLRLLRRFPLAEPTILNPYRPVIQELTNNRHESRGSSGVKLYLFAGMGKKPHIGKELERVKWFLWHGNVVRALDTIEDIEGELDFLPRDGESRRKLAKAVREFRGYIEANQNFIPRPSRSPR
jgi:hypothetical protein